MQTPPKPRHKSTAPPRQLHRSPWIAGGFLILCLLFFVAALIFLFRGASDSGRTGGLPALTLHRADSSNPQRVIRYMSGQWQASFPKGTALFNAKEGNYELLFTFDPNLMGGHTRLYSAGQLQTGEEFVSLVPKREEKTNQPESHMIYTMRAFHLKVHVRGNTMIWEPGPPVPVGFSRTPGDHPIFRDAREDVITWHSVKE